MKIRMINISIPILLLAHLSLQAGFKNSLLNKQRVKLHNKNRLYLSNKDKTRTKSKESVRDKNKEKSKQKSKNMIADSDTLDSEYDPDFQFIYDQEKEQEEQKEKQKALDSLQSVSYVHQISSYGKHQLNDQKLRKNSYMVGKPVYFESGLTFDDTPQLYSDPSTKAMSQVDVPMNQNTMEKRNLWYNKEHQPEQTRNSPVNMDQKYNDVYYKNKEGDIINGDKFNTMDTLHSSVVGVQTVNRDSYKQNKQNDKLLTESGNPLKQQLFEKIKSQKFNIDIRNRDDDKNKLISQLGDKLEEDLDKDLDSIA